MTRNFKLTATCILCVVMTVFLTGCPGLFKFKIKFINTRSNPIVGAYLAPVTQEGMEPEDWGPNLLPVAQLDELEYVVFPDEYLKGRYWMKVTVMVEDTVVELFDEEFNDYHMDSFGLREEYLTWMSGYEGEFDSSIGYSYGWIPVAGETEVIP